MDIENPSRLTPFETTSSSSSYYPRSNSLPQPEATASLDETKIAFSGRKASHTEAASPNYWAQTPASATINWMGDAFSPAFNSTLLGPGFASQNLSPMQVQRTTISPTSASYPKSDTGLMQSNAPAIGAEKAQYSSRHWLDTVVGQDMSMEPSTPSSGSQATSGTGRFYVDGDGGRLPKVGMQRRMTFRGSVNASSRDTPMENPRKRKFDFPILHNPIHENQQEMFSKLQLVSEEIYFKTHDYFAFLCKTSSPYFAAFETSNFPSRDTLNSFIQLYLEFFQPLVPVLHFPTLELGKSHCLLSLALATIGSHFADFDRAGEYAASMNEFLRRAVQMMVRQNKAKALSYC